MSPKRWIALLAFYISYLMLGASIYFHIESHIEKEKRAEDLLERIEINELLVKNLSPGDTPLQESIIQQVSTYCEKPLSNHTFDQFEDPYRWTFYHSLIFAFTVCSTVGYGNLSPSTTTGQMIMICYSLIGIPINGILFAGLGDYFGRTFTRIYHRYKEYKMSNNALYVPRQFGLVATVTFALVPGITFFIIFPSLVFSYFEGWPFTLSLYYAYVTTTTIGFGDYVPTFQADGERKFGGLYICYQIFIIVWFIFALGYLVMIMTFITKGLRSKKFAYLEHQLSANIKATQNRIWSGVTKDVGYLRRILNELYIMKFKPVYHEPGHKFNSFDADMGIRRAVSCPELTFYRQEEPLVARKRAFSENLESTTSRQDLQQILQHHGTLIRTSSDTDIQKINKEKTFETARPFMQTADLLTKVVTALGSIRAMDEDVESIRSAISPHSLVLGYHGLSDSQILASERCSIGSTNDKYSLPYFQRERACSDFQIPIQSSKTPNEWTWSGDNNQIQEVINHRVKATSRQGKNSVQFFTPDRPVILNIDNELNSEVPSKQENKPKGIKRLKPFKKRSKEDLSKVLAFENEGPKVEYVDVLEPKAKQYIERTSRGSISFAPSNLYVPPPKSVLMNRRQSLFADGRRQSVIDGERRSSLFSVPSQEEIDQRVLETTTIADLIRAVEAIHTQDHDKDSGVAASGFLYDSTNRNTGFNSLTPPKNDTATVFSLLQQSKTELASAPQTYHGRRNTVFDSSVASSMPYQTVNSSRRMSTRPPVDPPPYTEHASPRFTRRFSVRPTNLQTPPGQAPPPTAPIQPLSTVCKKPHPTKAVPPMTSKTALQRRLSLRPSPLARELADTTKGRTFTGRSLAAQSSRTHSPLTRIAQMQAASSRHGYDSDKRITDESK